ncbi:MAG: glycosyltransferase [Mojavia pulchra JT2-VF2]|jgi:glycosyltransferase involved in cell wall biosynthesis|uniref:Glycosyltransferase n=1 Tax=Mojavia pulchra JT2-VF2 TaxID=287848 RepID=A0A951Q635_9NOST|nr:glycosyltransferase [Mojavia pulchra JT2-VF2]
MKLVSVIIPVYRAEKYIAATVQSVLDQTYKNFELLIIDDGSPDKSVEICQQFTDPRIKIIRQENRGVAAARNQGICASEGQYIAFLDADDLWKPTKLEKHVNHLDNLPDVGVSYSYAAFINAEGQPLGLYQLPKTKNITPLHILLRDPIGSGSNLVARREVFEAIKFKSNLDSTVKDFYFDEDRQLHPSEDTECWLRMTMKSDLKFEGIPEVLIQYRMHSGGYSHQFSKKAASWDKLLEKAHTYAPELMEQWENAARAYQLTAIARRAVNQGAGGIAVELNHRALASYWRIILEEPRRTLLTLVAAYLLLMLPKPLYSRMQSLAFETVSATQKRRLT